MLLLNLHPPYALAFVLLPPPSPISLTLTPGLWLHSSSQYRYRNPIPGQQEVTCHTARDGDAAWAAAEGFYFPPRAPAPKDKDSADL